MMSLWPACPILLISQANAPWAFTTTRDLPFYYFMAANFATSDRWFSPAPTRTHPNRFYWMAATSQGVISPPDQQITPKTIFEVMDNNNISWKIYTTDGHTYFSYFIYFNAHHANVVPLSQYFTDVKNGTLPQVAYIETGIEINGTSSSGVDEHPKSNIQIGAQFAAKADQCSYDQPVMERYRFH